MDALLARQGLGRAVEKRDEQPQHELLCAREPGVVQSPGVSEAHLCVLHLLEAIAEGCLVQDQALHASGGSG